MQKKRKVGAPTKWVDDIPEKLINYFSEQRYFTIGDKEYPEFNSVEGFCAHIKISKDTFYRWVKEKSQLSDAFGIAKNYQAKQLFNLGANRVFDSAYAKLLTVNCTDMKDKVDHQVEQKTIQINIDSDDDQL